MTVTPEWYMSFGFASLTEFLAAPAAPAFKLRTVALVVSV